MKENFERIINQLTTHDITKEEAINKLLFLCSVSSSVKIGDRVRIDGYNEPDVKILEKNKDKALCKLNSGREYWYELYRIVRL